MHYTHSMECYYIILLLNDVKASDLIKLAEKLRSGVQQGLKLPDSSALTTSIGVALLQPDEDWEAWLHRADMALYQAKHEGRNRVIVA